jgi:probable phosphoglycerate mutase
VEIVVIRHGETEWSLAGRHTSHTDLPLTEAGRRRASSLAGELSPWSFSLVLTSPLRRAIETCELAGLGADAEICEDLREWDYGDFEGQTTAQIREHAPDWELWRDGCPGGERPDHVAARADRALERLSSAGGDAIAFAHGHILRVLAARWIGMEPAAGACFALNAGAVSALGFEHDNHVLDRWNS